MASEPAVAVRCGSSQAATPLVLTAVDNIRPSHVAIGRVDERSAKLLAGLAAVEYRGAVGNILHLLLDSISHPLVAMTNAGHRGSPRRVQYSPPILENQIVSIPSPEGKEVVTEMPVQHSRLWRVFGCSCPRSSIECPVTHT